jgi:hypothetical protein
MDVCLCYVMALWRADSPSKESYRLYQVKKLKWNEAFRGFLVFQVGAIWSQEEEEEEESFQPHYGPGIDSASNRNEYQESSWG